MKSYTLHWISLAVGLLFLVPSIALAVFFSYQHFYTAFAFGSWLVLDFIDWRLNGTSVLGYFFRHNHRDAFAAFLLLATIFCFLVDYVYGVKLSEMWEWQGYRTIHFVRMYLFMNASYVLGMYELFRVIRSLLSRKISTAHMFKLRLGNDTRRFLLSALIALGIIFLLAPLYALALKTDRFMEFVMILPFVGMLLLSDGITGALNGKPVLSELVRGNRLQFSSLLATALTAALVTEALNLYGQEWRYVKMPFPELQVAGIPVAVFVGWVPLVLGSIATVNLVKQADAIWDRRKKRQA